MNTPKASTHSATKIDVADDAAAKLISLHRGQRERYPFLLESVVGDVSSTARYSLLLAYPGDRLELRKTGLFENDQLLAQQDFLEQLDLRYRQQQPTTSASPFNGGWFLYLGYELAGQIEPSLALPEPASDLPVALAVYCPAAIVVDHQSGSLEVVVEEGHPEAEAMLQQIKSDLWDVQENIATAEGLAMPAVQHWWEEPDEQFLRNVERIQEYIRAGDVFQVNLSRQWQISYAAPPSCAEVYSTLRRENPAPFAGVFQWQGSAVISSSPERLIEVQGRDVQTRPIAGTRPRLNPGCTDASERESLILHPKERAEHIMLIDLERNDLGRVCETGSVVVDELLGMETYAHVHHIVSNLRGRLRQDATPVDAIRAVFPGGTITGCPKVHCMEIIAELEQCGRGPYTGAMGYLGRNGRLDLNILIRTLEISGTQIRFRTGAGIVADSDARAELYETRAKARGLLNALRLPA